MAALLANRSILLCKALIALSLTTASHAERQPPTSVIGTPYIVESHYQDTLLDIAQKHDMGYQELRLANPAVDMLLPGEGTAITIPASFVLPQVEHRGIVLNLAERRLYYFGEQTRSHLPLSFPIGIGRQGWLSPLGETYIKEKILKPSWYPPDSIRQAYAEQGLELPEVIPPGPANPLGNYALRLGKQRYLIHGTNRPDGVGMRTSHGCIRLRPEHIEQLYPLVTEGTRVAIIDQAIKAGWKGAQLYLEVHPKDSDSPSQYDNSTLIRAIIEATKNHPASINWQRVDEVYQIANGIPQAIGQLANNDDRK